MTENNPTFVAIGQADMVYFSFFYGVTSIFIVIHLLLSLFIREKLSLFYCIYLFFLTLAIALGNGHLILLEELNQQFFCFFMILTAIASLYISFQLFNSKGSISRTGFVVIFLIVILAPACMLLPIEISYLVITFLFASIIIYRVILSLMQLAASESQLFLVGTFSVLICSIIFEITSIKLWIITGAGLEMIFTSLVIGLKIKSTIEYNALHTIKNFRMSSNEIQITTEERNVLIPEMDADNLFIIKSLTAREKEVLSLLAEGLKDDELASRLKLSVTTIKTHLRNLYSKLNVRSRTEASIKYNNLLTMNK